MNYMIIVLWIFFAMMLLIGLVLIIRQIVVSSYFKAGHNPYSRICKKCGAHQNMYQSNIEGQENATWWEEVYPIGNDENCRCHKYAEYH